MGESSVLVERGLDDGPAKLADVGRPERRAPAPLASRWRGIGVDQRDEADDR